MSMGLKDKVWPRFNDRHHFGVVTGVNAVLGYLQQLVTGCEEMGGFCWEQTAGTAEPPVGQPHVRNGRKGHVSAQVREPEGGLLPYPRWILAWPGCGLGRRGGCRDGREVDAGGAVDDRWQEEAESAFRAGATSLRRFEHSPRLALRAPQDQCILGWSLLWCPSGVYTPGDLGRVRGRPYFFVHGEHRRARG